MLEEYFSHYSQIAKDNLVALNQHAASASNEQIGPRP